jgi:hypothetical protein
MGHPNSIDTPVLSSGKTIDYPSHILAPMEDRLYHPVAGFRTTSELLHGHSGRPTFDNDGKVIGMAASMRVTDRMVSDFVSVEQIDAIMKQVKAAEPARGWLEIHSKVATRALTSDELAKHVPTSQWAFKERTPPYGAALPLNITATSRLRDRVDLARSVHERAAFAAMVRSDPLLRFLAQS